MLSIIMRGSDFELFLHPVPCHVIYGFVTPVQTRINALVQWQSNQDASCAKRRLAKSY